MKSWKTVFSPGILLLWADWAGAGDVPSSAGGGDIRLGSRSPVPDPDTRRFATLPGTKPRKRKIQNDANVLEAVAPSSQRALNECLDTCPGADAPDPSPVLFKILQPQQRDKKIGRQKFSGSKQQYEPAQARTPMHEPKYTLLIRKTKSSAGEKSVASVSVSAENAGRGREFSLKQVRKERTLASTKMIPVGREMNEAQMMELLARLDPEFCECYFKICTKVAARSGECAPAAAAPNSQMCFAFDALPDETCQQKHARQASLSSGYSSASSGSGEEPGAAERVPSGGTSDCPVLREIANQAVSARRQGDAAAVSLADSSKPQSPLLKRRNAMRRKAVVFDDCSSSSHALPADCSSIGCRHSSGASSNRSSHAAPSTASKTKKPGFLSGIIKRFSAPTISTAKTHEKGEPVRFRQHQTLSLASRDKKGYLKEVQDECAEPKSAESLSLASEDSCFSCCTKIRDRSFGRRRWSRESIAEPHVGRALAATIRDHSKISRVNRCVQCKKSMWDALRDCFAVFTKQTLERHDEAMELTLLQIMKSMSAAVFDELVKVCDFNATDLVVFESFLSANWITTFSKQIIALVEEMRLKGNNGRMNLSRLFEEVSAQKNCSDTLLRYFAADFSPSFAAKTGEIECYRFAKHILPKRSQRQQVVPLVEKVLSALLKSSMAGDVRFNQKKWVLLFARHGMGHALQSILLKGQEKVAFGASGLEGLVKRALGETREFGIFMECLFSSIRISAEDACCAHRLYCLINAFKMVVPGLLSPAKCVYHKSVNEAIRAIGIDALGPAEMTKIAQVYAQSPLEDKTVLFRAFGRQGFRGDKHRWRELESAVVGTKNIEFILSYTRVCLPLSAGGLESVASLVLSGGSVADVRRLTRDLIDLNLLGKDNIVEYFEKVLLGHPPELAPELLAYCPPATLMKCAGANSAIGGLFTLLLSHGQAETAGHLVNYIDDFSVLDGLSRPALKRIMSGHTKLERNINMVPCANSRRCHEYAYKLYYRYAGVFVELLISEGAAEDTIAKIVCDVIELEPEDCCDSTAIIKDVAGSVVMHCSDAALCCRILAKRPEKQVNGAVWDRYAVFEMEVDSAHVHV
ncbi:hypothetical protein PAPHI01_1116 [Pancytospora philotis]|nr:hypothetical protein PAPHI01_1116 [Pancytospora philotis]